MLLLYVAWADPSNVLIIVRWYCDDLLKFFNPLRLRPPKRFFVSSTVSWNTLDFNYISLYIGDFWIPFGFIIIWYCRQKRYNYCILQMFRKFFIIIIFKCKFNDTITFCIVKLCTKNKPRQNTRSICSSMNLFNIVCLFNKRQPHQ